MNEVSTVIGKISKNKHFLTNSNSNDKGELDQVYNADSRSGTGTGTRNKTEAIRLDLHKVFEHSIFNNKK